MALDREQIMRTALRLLEEVGLEPLSLRRLARELDVQPSALYWHFKNKQELLDEMARAIVIEAVTDDDAVPDPAGDTWQDLLMHLARAQHRAVRRHRDGATLMLSARPLSDYQLNYLDWVLGRLTEAGFTPAGAAEAFAVIANYALGTAVVEQRSGRATIDGDFETARAAHPSLSLIADHAGDADAVFERGLRWLLAGMAATRA